MVGDEHQLPPTVRDRNADWDGLGNSLMARLNTILTTPTSVDALISDRVVNRLD